MKKIKIIILIVILVISTLGIGAKMISNYELNDELFKAVSGELILDRGYTGHGDIEKVKALLKEGADVNAVNNNGSSLLMQSKDPDIIQVLLDEGIDVNKKDNFGNTALMLHVENPEIINLLLKANAKVDIKDKKGNNVLMRAAKKGLANTVQLILDTDKIKINDTNKEGQTALMLASGLRIERILPTRRFLASEKGHLACVQALLNAKADIEVKDKTGKTALIYATQLVDTDQISDPKIDSMSISPAEKLHFVMFDSLAKPQSEQLQIVNLLLEQGADKNHKDKSKKTALNYAEEMKSNISEQQKEIYDLLNEIITLLKQ